MSLPNPADKKRTDAQDRTLGVRDRPKGFY